MADYGGAMMRGGNDSGVQARTKAHNRANQLQLKLIGQSHPTGLTTNLLRLFEARPPLEYRPPVEKRKLPAYTGNPCSPSASIGHVFDKTGCFCGEWRMAQFVSQFLEPDDPEYAKPVPKGETRAEKKARIHQLKLEEGAAKVTEELQKYDPQNDPNATGDPYKTLFAAGLNYETSEHRIKREFEAYGPIKRVRLVTDKITNKPRGYAFIEYMHTRDMKNAYKQADGRKIDNKRILVDVERGRTVPSWRPRRLGGGLGSSRITSEDAVQKHSARYVHLLILKHIEFELMLRVREQHHVGRPGPEEPRTRKDDRHADRDREKSRERIRERSRDERTRESSHDRNRDSREERHHHKDRERTRDRDRERDRGRDRHDRGKHRDHGQDYERERERERSYDRHCGRSRDQNRDYERDRRYLRERDADYGDGEPRHDRSLAEYGQDYSYSHYEQQKSHQSYGYDQDGYEEHYKSRPDNAEAEAPEEGEGKEGDYQHDQVDDYKN
uniref:RRM domain-containing protein n=1 Tax=Leersia perrieri TaxID=77586 RepID=A0A0D9XLC4_9ORYZ